MQAFEVTGTINSVGQLTLDQPLHIDYPGQVKVIVLLPESNQESSEANPQAELASTARPIWERVDQISAQVPIKDWSTLPQDLSKNLDHYLYGSPKTEL
ncbi:hypothetical protein ACN4EK_13770 [Pantanalinema rosaneae CENA516]|uniref:hypothetical protein n=1 Tax=Pantanalinema rosaneae TaxID=1620701 RepID=UPI003D6F3CC0